MVSSFSALLLVDKFKSIEKYPWIFSLVHKFNQSEAFSGGRQESQADQEGGGT